MGDNRIWPCIESSIPAFIPRVYVRQFKIDSIFCYEQGSYLYATVFHVYPFVANSEVMMESRSATVSV